MTVQAFYTGQVAPRRNVCHSNDYKQFKNALYEESLDDESAVRIVDNIVLLGGIG
jgi:hypothetical protein